MSEVVKLKYGYYKKVPEYYGGKLPDEITGKRYCLFLSLRKDYVLCLPLTTTDTKNDFYHHRILKDDTSLYMEGNKDKIKEDSTITFEQLFLQSETEFHDENIIILLPKQVFIEKIENTFGIVVCLMTCHDNIERGCVYTDFEADKQWIVLQDGNPTQHIVCARYTMKHIKVVASDDPFDSEKIPEIETICKVDIFNCCCLSKKWLTDNHTFLGFAEAEALYSVLDKILYEIKI